MSAPIPNQSYLVKQIENKMAACLAALIHDLGAPNVWLPSAWNNAGSLIHTPVHWRKDSQVFSAILYPGHGSNHPEIQFSNVRLPPGSGSIEYGQKRVAQKVLVNDDGKSKIVENKTDVPISVAYEEAEEVTNSYGSSITKGIVLDMSIDTETTVSGEYAGVSAEEKVSTHFGVSKSEEESRQESHEGTTSEALSIAFEANPRQSYLVTIHKEHETTYQDFSINGIQDFDLTIRLHADHQRNQKYCPHGTVNLVGIEALMQFVFGYDTNYPEMQGYWNKAVSRVRNGINWIAQPENRRIQASGTNEANLEDNVDYKVEQLGGSIPDSLAHLPVVNALDVEG